MAAVVATALVLPLSVPASATPVKVGYRDFSYGSSVSAPTGQKPQSKLWFNGGQWWGALYSTSAHGFTIHGLDWASQEWTDTGVTIDERESSQVDALWDGTKLYTASAGTGTAAGDSAELRRFSYTPAGGFTLDAGFPAQIVSGGMEAGVFDKDTTGTLWFTYTRSNAVYVTHTTVDDGTWATPFVIPVSGASTLTSDDISAVVSYDGNIGVMWSNQADSTMYFATHVDGAAPNQWTVNPAVQLPEYADDHLNLKSLQATADGRVYAATKTSLNSGNAPLMLLLVLSSNGSWQRHTVATVADNHTRPLVLIDQENRQLYWFASSPCCSGGTIYYKQTPLDNINFATGLGTPFIQSSLDPKINNISSTKQALDSSTGLVAIAGDDSTRTYLHNAFTLGPSSGPPETTITSGPSGDVTETSATFTFTSSAPGSFECSLDGAAYSGCTTPATYPGLTLGAHTFDVRARDTSGAVDPSPAHANWTIVSGGGTTTTIERSIAASSDDAEQWQNGGVNLTSSDLELVEDSGRGVQTVGMRFTNLAIPPDATVTNAWIQFTVDEASSGATSLTFRAEAVDNAATFTTATGSIGARPRTTAQTTWAPPAWTAAGAAGTDQRTPALTAPIQEVVSRPGWAAGNAIAMIVTGSGTRWAEAWDGNVAGAPRLHTEYSSAPGGGDTIPPDTTITSKPSNPSSSADATFAFTATESGSTFECTLDGAAFSSCSSPKAYSGLADGPHDFAVRATDAAGNTDASPAAWAWTIDTASPAISGTTPTNGAANVPVSSTVTATFNEPMNPTSLSGSTFTLKQGSGSVSGSVAYTATTRVVTLTPSAALGQNLSYTAAINGATDLAGNALPVTTWTFTTEADTTPPDTTITSKPSNPSSSAGATFAFTVTESGSTFECALDGAAYSSCSSPTTYTGLADGAHTFAVRATDDAGNTDASPAIWSWTIDTTVPPEPTTVTFNPQADTYMRQASPSTNYGTAATLVADGVDGGGATEAVLRFPVSGVSGGVQQALLRIWVTNKTNGGPSIYLSDPSWTEALVTWNNRPARIGGVVTTSGAIPTGWHTFDVTSAITGDGTYGFTLVPTSSDGLDFSSREGSTRPQLVITYGGSDTTPPETTILSGPSDPSDASTATFTFKSSELGSTFTCSLDGATPTSCTSPKVYSGLATGPHTFSVRATDVSGNADPTPSTATWTVVASTSATFTAGADSYADQGRSTTNYGSSATLESDGDSGRANEAFLRFTVGGTTGSVVSAKVRLWITNATVDGPRIYRSTDGWSEATVNWNTRPMPIGDPLFDAGAMSSGAWYEFDVTPAVTGNGTYNFTLLATSTDGVKFGSRESPTAPTLVVVFGN